MRRAAPLRGALGLVLCAGLSSVCRADEALQPYQLVRSLQLVQDRIAGGDQAALPMQGKLLEMVDERLRTASPEDFKEPRNFRALLVYGMSGGNPVTVAAAASRVVLDAQDKAIASGILAYLNGRPAIAIEALKPVDPMTLPSDIGAFLALVKGSLLATQDPVQALMLLDEARLLSPGTLVEEAALRRSVAIAVARGDAARFALASTQYVERFLYSPYASQFADSFVSGVIALHASISQDKLGDITSMMDAEREKVIYLRIARRAAIDGLNDLSTFASATAERGRDGKGNGTDPRALLYASLSTVTSDTVDDVRAKLKKIDRSQLSDGDRSLLDAAQAVADELTAPPAPVPVKSDAATAVATVTDASAQAGLPPVEGAMAEQPASGPQAPPAAAPLPAAASSAPAAPTSPPTVNPTQAVAAVSVPAASPAPDTGDPTDAAIADARRKLDSVDQILGASPK